MRSGQRLFVLVVGLFTLLAAAPFWLTRILPFQDYPQILVLARAFGDCQDPSTPFFGTYERGFTVGPLLLPILLLRGIGAVAGLETAGRVLWTAYAVGLPLSSLFLLRALGRDRWAVLLVFPLVMSYWVAGGFFAFATAAPILVLGLAFTVRWLTSSEPRDAVGVVVVGYALYLWHALSFAQYVMAFVVLWTLRRYDHRRARAKGLTPIFLPLAFFAFWLVFAVLRRGPGGHPPTWAPFFDNASQFLDFLLPILPEAAGVTLLLALLLAAGALGRAPVAPATVFRVDNPFGWLALLTALTYFVLPVDCFGVEGINTRQPWVAALFLVFGYGLPTARAPRAALLGLIGGAGALGLVTMGQRFAAFDAESGGASRLIDRLGPGDTLLAPMGAAGATSSFPAPAKPLVALELYATIRHGGLPNTSFAGYDVNIVRYAHGKNPMPGLGMDWDRRPEDLRRFDYLLLRGPAPESPPYGLELVAADGDFQLYGVCGSRSRPECP